MRSRTPGRITRRSRRLSTNGSRPGRPQDLASAIWRRSAVPACAQRDQVERIHRHGAVTRRPVQMWSCDAPGVADQPDNLSALHGVASRHQRLAHVEVRGDYSAAVVDVDDIPGEKEPVDERNDSTIGRADRLTDRTPEVDTKMSRRQLAVEDAPRPEFTGDHGGARLEKRIRPHWRMVVRGPADLARTRVLALDAGDGSGVQRLGEAAVDGEWLRYRRRDSGKRESYASYLGLPRRPTDHRVGSETPFGVDRHATDRVPRARRRSNEVERLFGKGATNRDDRVASGRSVQRQPDD